MPTELQTSRKLEMNKMRYLLMIACAAVFVCGSVWDVEKVNNVKYVTIDVYYDAADANSRHFFFNQLDPTLDTHWRNTYFRLMPYGKTTREQKDGKWIFTCRRGEYGCLKNKIHGCINKHTFTGPEKYKLTLCNMRETWDGFAYVLDPALTLVHCLEKYQKTSELEILYNCATGSEGDRILALYGSLTDNLKKPLDYLPTVSLVSTFGETNILSEETARKGLSWEVCRAAKAEETNIDGCVRYKWSVHEERERQFLEKYKNM